MCPVFLSINFFTNEFNTCHLSKQWNLDGPGQTVSRSITDQHVSWHHSRLFEDFEILPGFASCFGCFNIESRLFSHSFADSFRPLALLKSLLKKDIWFHLF